MSSCAHLLSVFDPLQGNMQAQAESPDSVSLRLYIVATLTPCECFVSFHSIAETYARVIQRVPRRQLHSHALHTNTYSLHPFCFSRREEYGESIVLLL